MTNYSERLGLLIEAIVVREAAGVCPVTGEPHTCADRDATDGAACEGCDGPEMAESRTARVGAIFEAARKQSKAAKKAAALKAKFINPKTGAFKGKKGERFKNCAAYMKAKGGVRDPKALCGSIARRKAMGEAIDDGSAEKLKKLLQKKITEASDAHYKLAEQLKVLKVGLEKSTVWPKDFDDKQARDSAQQLDRLARTLDFAWGTAANAFTSSTMKNAQREALWAKLLDAASDVDKFLSTLFKQLEQAKVYGWSIGEDFGTAIEQGMRPCIDLRVEASFFRNHYKRHAIGEAVGWTLAESEEADPRQLIESGDAMIKMLEGRLDALRKGLVAAQAALKGYARIGVPNRAASALLKAHLLVPAESFEDMAKKVRETIEEGIKVYG